MAPWFGIPGRCFADGMVGEMQALVDEIIARVLPQSDLKSLLRNPEYIEQMEALLGEDRVLHTSGRLIVWIERGR